MAVTSQDDLHVVMAASEAVPYAKTGGLADAVTALAIELSKLGHRVTLPLPGCRGQAAQPARPGCMRFSISPAGTKTELTVEEELVPVTGASHPLRVFLVQYDPYFDRRGLYQDEHHDYPDNLERFTLFCLAVLHALRILTEVQGEQVDVLHLHDWQTALCSVYLKALPQEYKGLQRIKTLLTLHNLGYQGIFSAQEFAKTGLPPSLFSPSNLEFYGSVNCLKGGIIYSDAVSTVSPTYAKEIITAEYGCGLEGVLSGRLDGVRGITNGIDTTIWNPEHDSYLPARYTAADLAGKQACKLALQEEFGLPGLEAPVFGVIGRLTFQKGFDLLIDIIPELMSMELQFVFLGTGDHDLEQQIRAAKAEYPEKIGLSVGFDEGLAHRIEAGADMLIMPSRYEPCGLSQLYSLRYGTVPIVRRTGGLADTVVPFHPSTVKSRRATGFHFIEPFSDALLSTLMLSLHVYEKLETWNSLVISGMGTDLSWRRSAQQYIDLYRSMARDKRRG
jgi:starch synthase